LFDRAHDSPPVSAAYLAAVLMALRMRW
jgi:hypothetical protein